MSTPHAPNAPSLDDIRAFVAEMQPIMGLRDWRFHVKAKNDQEMPDGWLQIYASHSHLEADIAVCVDALNGAMPRPWRAAVIHELTHCYEGIFAMQIAALMRATIPDEAIQNVIVGFLADLEESFVDRAAETIWRLYQQLHHADAPAS